MTTQPPHPTTVTGIRPAKRRLIALAAAVGLSACVGLPLVRGHAGGHEIPGGSSMDLKYPRLVSEQTRQVLGIQTAPVKKRTIDDVVRVTGAVRSKPDLHARVAAPVVGRVREARANVGQKVAAPGEVLALVDSVEAARLQSQLLAEGQQLRHAREHWERAEAVSRQIAANELAGLYAQYQTARDALRAAERNLTMSREGGESVPKKELVANEAEQAKAAAAVRGLEGRLAAIGVTGERLKAFGDAAGDPLAMLADGRLKWEQVAALGKPLEVLAMLHEYHQHGIEVERLSRELRLLGFDEQAVSDLASGKGAPGPLAVRAPVAGTVTVRNVSVGQSVAADQPLFEVVDASKVWVEAEVPEAMLGRVLSRQSDAARVRSTAAGGDALDGRVVTVAPAVNAQTRTAAVVVEVDNAAGRLLLGSFVEASLVVRQAKEALSVPKDAVVRQGPLTFVWVATGGGDEHDYEKRDVLVGAADDRFAEIAKGDLSPLHSVVTQGAYQLTLIPAVSRPKK